MNQNLKLKLMASVISVAFASAAPAVAQQGRPTDVNDTLTVEGICAFPVLLEAKGKAKSIELPGGGAILTSPGLTATLTNLDDPTKQVSMGITGAFHLTFPENGDTKYVVTGRNLLFGFDPDAAFVLAIGRFSFVFDADGNLVQPVLGRGKVIDICELLS